MQDQQQQKLVLDNNGLLGIGTFQERIMLTGWREAQPCETWNLLQTDDGTFSRGQVRIEEGIIIASRPRYKYLETPVTGELQELLRNWRTRGFDRQADAVEFAPEDGDIWPYLEERVEDGCDEFRYPFDECKFFRTGIRLPAIKLEVISEDTGNILSLRQ